MLLWAFAAFIAFFVKGLCGFANTPVLSVIVAFANDNRLISPASLLLDMPTNVYLVWRERKSIDLRVCAPLAALVLLGCLPGVWLLKHIDPAPIKLVFGFVVAALGVEMFFREKNGKKMRPSRVLMGAVGLVAGVLCGLFGIGALLAAYIGRVTDDMRAFRGNLCTVFLTENVFRLALYAATGILTLASVRRALLAAPFMLLGLALGVKCSGKIDDHRIRLFASIMLVVTGVVMIASNL